MRLSARGKSSNGQWVVDGIALATHSLQTIHMAPSNHDRAQAIEVFENGVAHIEESVQMLRETETGDLQECHTGLRIEQLRNEFYALLGSVPPPPWLAAFDALRKHFRTIDPSIELQERISELRKDLLTLVAVHDWTKIHMSLDDAENNVAAGVAHLHTTFVSIVAWEPTRGSVLEEPLRSVYQLALSALRREHCRAHGFIQEKINTLGANERRPEVLHRRGGVVIRG